MVLSVFDRGLASHSHLVSCCTKVPDKEKSKLSISDPKKDTGPEPAPIPKSRKSVFAAPSTASFVTRNQAPLSVAGKVLTLNSQP